MVEASTEITVTPKQLGKHLRSIRRKKGLSLSEVARGAGLSRRELVNYERGKVPIPESDLWVLAGSCGVDAAELVPSTSTLELTAAAEATSVGDTVSQLRRSQEDAGIAPYLHTLQKLQSLPPGKRIPVKDRELEDIAAALGSTPSSIERKLQEVLGVSPQEAERLRAMIVVPPTKRGKPRALAAASTPPETSAAVAPPVAPAVPLAPPEPVQTLPVAPAAFLDTPLDAPLDPVNGHNVDVFEELARLPEPVPLGDPMAPVPDLLAPQDPFAAPPLVGVPVAGPPEGTVELVDTAMPAASAHGFGAIEATPWNAADAPPIDVAARQGSSTWDLGEPPLTAREAPTPEAPSWDGSEWQPPAPPDGPDNGNGAGFWQSTDQWEPLAAVAEAPVEPPIAGSATIDETVVPDFGEPPRIGEETWAGPTWDAEPWGQSDPPAAETAEVVDVNPWAAEWPREPADLGAWDHRPDPAAVDSGFYVDWGTPDTESPPAWDVFAAVAPTTPEPDSGVEAVDDPTALWGTSFTPAEAETNDFAPAWEHDVEVAASDESIPFGDDPFTIAAPVDPFEPVDPGAPVEPVDLFAGIEPVTPVESLEPVDLFAGIEPARPVIDEVGLAPISWRADGTNTDLEASVDEPELAHPDAAAASIPVALSAEATDDPIQAPAPIEEFVSAGSDWQLGNALPLVEVQSQGGLVMRRADERWALADITTAHDFVVEVEVDFRSGPGLGVLFRASVDDEGRMSGYSFDIDPIYDGGGFLVRQWHGDRELWNPIARVSGDDPSSMYGPLLVRLVVEGEHLSASVNGVEVLTVENLKQASADRGRDAASGDRVGVQAWSSSDLVIDSVRVAAR